MIHSKGRDEPIDAVLPQPAFQIARALPRRKSPGDDAVERAYRALPHIDLSETVSIRNLFLHPLGIFDVLERSDLNTMERPARARVFGAFSPGAFSPGAFSPGAFSPGASTL